MCGRAIKPKLPFVPGQWAAAAASVRDLLAFDPIVPLNPQQFLDRPQVARKREKVRQAISNAHDIGVTPRLTKRLGSFIKIELLPAVAPVDEVLMLTKEPRLIQPVSEEAQYLLGRWVHPFSKEVASKWSFRATPESPVTYASGMTSIQVGEWMTHVLESYDSPTFYEVDFKRWDATLNEEALRVEHDILNAMGLDPLARKVLEAQLYTNGVTAHGVRYSVPATRKSGDPNTSVGNSLLNAVSTLSFMLPRVPCKLIVLGDDMLCATERPIDSVAFEKHLRGFGLDPEMKVWTGPNAHHRASFCSSYFWPAWVDGGLFGCQRKQWHYGHVLAPCAIRTLSKLGHYVRAKGEVCSESWCVKYMNGVLRSSLPHGSVVPCVGPLLKRYAGDTVLSPKNMISKFRVWELDLPTEEGTYDSLCSGLVPVLEAAQMFHSIYGTAPVVNDRATMLSSLLEHARP